MTKIYDLTNMDAGEDEPFVYAVHPVKDDVRSAETFGEIVYLNDRYVYPDELGDGGELPAVVMSKLTEGANDFEPTLDYLLLVGDHVQQAFLIYKLAQLGKSFRLLRYDRQARGYVPVQIGDA